MMKKNKRNPTKTYELFDLKMFDDMARFNPYVYEAWSDRDNGKKFVRFFDDSYDFIQKWIDKGILGKGIYEYSL